MILDSRLFTAALILAIIAMLLFQQMRPRELKPRRLLLVPLIILIFLVRSVPQFEPTPARSVELAITVIISLVFGLLACRELRVYFNSQRVVMTSGSWRYFLWWLAALGLKALISVLFGTANFAKVSQFEFMTPPFLLLATRNAYLYWRARKLAE